MALVAGAKQVNLLVKKLKSTFTISLGSANGRLLDVAIGSGPGTNSSDLFVPYRCLKQSERQSSVRNPIFLGK